MSIPTPPTNQMTGNLLINGGEIRISIKLAILIQLFMMAAGAGATYTATRAAIEADHQKIDEQARAITSLQFSVSNTQTTLAGLTVSIDFLTKEVQSMRDRLFDDGIGRR